MDNTPISDTPTLTARDFKSDQMVRWCPGCGDYAILASVQKALPKIGKRKVDVVFISGIGCSSRFPYYMDTYGIHSIHGRALTLATGLKSANPELAVFVVTGDGDGLSIGGNHLLHACRRNVDLNILLFNNRIYGLTKGQYSPTSLHGSKTKSSPMGVIDFPLNPIAVAISAETTFIARSLDKNTRLLDEVIIEAAAHRGTSFIEILQNCLIFNDGAWDHVAAKSVRGDAVLYLKHGQPMVFGKDHDRGVRLNGLKPEVVYFEDGYNEGDLLVHDETDSTMAYMLAHMDSPEYPVPMGVIYRVQRPVYEMQLSQQVELAQQEKGKGDLAELYRADYTWEVSADAPTTVRHAQPDYVSTPIATQYMRAVSRSIRGETLHKTDIHEGLATDPIANVIDPDRPLVMVAPDTPLDETIKQMQDKDVSAVLVVDKSNRPIGIFTNRDVLLKIATQVEDLSDHVVADFMTRNPRVRFASAPIAHALYLMSIHRCRHVPLVDELGMAVGMVSFRSVIDYIEQYFDTIRS